MAGSHGRELWFDTDLGDESITHAISLHIFNRQLLQTVPHFPYYIEAVSLTDLEDITYVFLPEFPGVF